MTYAIRRDIVSPIAIFSLARRNLELPPPSLSLSLSLSLFLFLSLSVCLSLSLSFSPLSRSFLCLIQHTCTATYTRTLPLLILTLYLSICLFISLFLLFFDRSIIFSCDCDPSVYPCGFYSRLCCASRPQVCWSSWMTSSLSKENIDSMRRWEKFFSSLYRTTRRQIALMPTRAEPRRIDYVPEIIVSETRCTSPLINWLVVAMSAERINDQQLVND